MTEVLLLAAIVAAEPARPFLLEVVDEETGRGVPLVELRTVHGIRLVTDSNGLAVFDEPGLMNQTVFIQIASHGYEHAADGFGYRGIKVDVQPGGRAAIKIKRRQIAERLYRVTGAGIYRDTILAGRQAPIARPLLNAQVVGSDSVLNAVYRGKIYWFWGDTLRPSYPLGNFHVPGAVSQLPGRGGLDPSVGVDLSYFVAADGFAKSTCVMPGKGPTWIQALAAVTDRAGRERLYAWYGKVEPPLTIYARGLAVFDDEKEEFVKVRDLNRHGPIAVEGHAFRYQSDGIDYLYFASPYPMVRVRADPAALEDPSQYEAYTCLKAGSRLDQPELDRASDGSLRYAWKRNTPPLLPAEQAKLERAGRMSRAESPFRLADRDNGTPILAHAGSVNWNPYRQRWIMIATEQFGKSSLLGEVWYAEADAPEGPWRYAVKIVTHDRYSFYNPKQHPMFDQQGGRIVYFEGTYSHTFSGNSDATPRYDYNQVMYRLDLADERLALPRPVPGAAYLALDREVAGSRPVPGVKGFFMRTTGGGITRPLNEFRPGQDGTGGYVWPDVPAAKAVSR